jgi:L-alanine-DL-glutamate epimerase-like enolase superfamily enzyme
MKIAGLCLIRLEGTLDPSWHWAGEKDTVHPLHRYAEFRRRPDPPPDHPIPMVAYYVEIGTDDGPTGRYGPIYEEQAFIIARKLRPFLVGREVGPADALWDLMYGLDRHMQTGLGMMAVSAVDNALWDLRGKAAGEPVWRLLSERPLHSRGSLDCYRSTNDYPCDPEEIAAFARENAREGYRFQKWFFRHGPGSGPEGVEADSRMVRAVREAAGPDAGLMFDCFMSWDLEHARAMAPALTEARPAWLEEPFPPRFFGDFRALRRELPEIPLATGEHLFTRWEVEPFLDAGLLAVVQCDPDWCGGITELVRICDMAAARGLIVVPHGHTIAAAIQVVASRPADVCPLVEVLPRHLHRMQHFHREEIAPSGGRVSPPAGAGLGIELDEGRVESRREVFA